MHGPSEVSWLHLRSTWARGRLRVRALVPDDINNVAHEVTSAPVPSPPSRVDTLRARLRPSRRSQWGFGHKPKNGGAHPVHTMGQEVACTGCTFGPPGEGFSPRVHSGRPPDPTKPAGVCTPCTAHPSVTHVFIPCARLGAFLWVRGQEPTAHRISGLCERRGHLTLRSLPTLIKACPHREDKCRAVTAYLPRR